MVFHLNFINPSRFVASASALALTATLAACGGTQTTQNTTTTPDSADNSAQEAAFKNFSLNEQVTLTGAGASFPAPIYQRWFQEISQTQPNLRVNYQSVGSGAGVRQFTQGTVDFGASDVAMTDEEIKKVERGVLMLPMTAGSIVLAYNLPNVETGLKLPREVYSGILLGEITNWNDPAIAKANPGVNLPDQAITVVYRSDGSGTTGVFTQHLEAISPEWKSKVGSGRTVQWPVGVGAKGNEGVTAQIQQTQGAIGYVEYGYAKQNKLNYAALENQAGNFIEPNEESAARTLEAVELPEDFRAFILDPQGEQSYPIVTYTWLLAYQQYPNPLTAKAMEGMIQYGLTAGQQYASELGYVPLPQNVKERVAAAADKLSTEYNIELGNTTATK